MKAGNRFALWEAFRFLKEAIGVLGKLPETKENKRRGIEARLLIIVTMMGLVYPEDSFEILGEGERLSKELGDQKALARFQGGIGMYHTMRGDIDLGTKYLENAFQAADTIQDLEILVPVGCQLCLMAMVSGNYLKVAEVAPRVISLLESRGEEHEPFGWAGFNPYLALVSTYGTALASLGNLKEGEALCQKGLRFATQMNDLASIAYAEYMYTHLLMIQGDGRNTVEHGLNAVRCSEEAQLLSLVGPAWNCLGYGYLFLGDITSALSCVEKGLGIMEASGFSGSLCMMYSNLGLMHLESGDRENARNCAEKALEMLPKGPGGFQEGFVRFISGSLVGETDTSRFAEGEECVLHGMKILDEAKTKPYYAYGCLYLGELYAHAGHKEKALSSLRRAWEMMQDMGMDYWLARTEKALKALQG